MARKNNGLNFIFGLTGILVTLAVAFGLIGGGLTIPFIPLIVMQVAGWIVVVLTLIGVAGWLMSLVK